MLDSGSALPAVSTAWGGSVPSGNAQLAMREDADGDDPALYVMATASRLSVRTRVTKNLDLILVVL